MGNNNPYNENLVRAVILRPVRQEWPVRGWYTGWCVVYMGCVNRGVKVCT